MKKLLCLALITALVPTLANANDERRIDITHTASYYANRGICVYHFDLQSMNPFSDLEITMNVLDTFGNVISTEKLDVESFGHDSASRYISSFIEMECPEKTIREFKAVRAVEKIGNKKVQLPMGIFHANNPELAKVSVQSTPNNKQIHKIFQGMWVTDKKLCADPEIQSDADYVVRISGDTVDIDGWVYGETETFDFNNEENYSSENGFGGWANYSGFYPDYSQSKGTRESGYSIENGYLNVGENMKLISCQK